MPSPKTPSFEEMFGVGSVPIASYFGLPQGASADPRFAPQARGMLAQGEEYARERAAMDAERAAEELLGGAADMTDEDIQQQLLRSPKMFGTQAIQPLSGYMQFRQSTTPQTDVTLGPILREKITDPYHREQFEKRMLEGASANDAFDAYRTDEYNMKFETALAEAGVPETEYAKLKTPSGKFIPSAVARAQATSKAAAKLVGTGKKVEPLDEEVEFLKDAIEQRKKIFEATGRADKLAADPLMLDYVSRYEKAANEKLTALRPPPKPVIGPATSVPVAAATVPQTRPVAPEIAQRAQEQQSREAERAAEVQKAEQEVAGAWDEQKLQLEERLRSAYKTPEELVGVAYEILNNTPVPVKTKVGANEVEDLVPYRVLIHRKLGTKPQEVAFEEPGNRRTGSQKVMYDELLKAWAETVVGRYEAQNQQQSQPAGQPAPASGKFSVGAPVKVGGP